MKPFSKIFSGYADYLEEIRKRILSIAAVFAVIFVAGFFEAGNIIRFIVGTFKLQQATIVMSSPFQFLDLATKVGFSAALLVSLPFIVYHLYSFLKAGLNRSERRLFLVLVPIGIVLFFTGFAYSYLILLFYLNSVSHINVMFGFTNLWDVGSFLYQIIWASVLLGLVFEFPLVLTFLIRIGLADAEYFRRKRFAAFALIFIFVGFLPPPDIFSTFFQALPLLIIYELTIRLNSAFPVHDRLPAMASPMEAVPKTV